MARIRRIKEFFKGSSDKRGDARIEHQPKAAALDPQPKDSNNSSTSKVAIEPWSEAEKRIKQDKTLNKVWEESIRILKSDFALKENDLHSFLSVMAWRLDSKKWTVSNDMKQTGTFPTDTREKLTKVCRNVLVFKDVITPTAAASPPVAIACAGVIVGLLLLIQAMEQHDTLLKGLETTSSLISRLHVIESHFLHRDANLSADLMRSLENDMVLLCYKVLEFQSRAICYLQKQSAVQLLTDMFKKDAWDEILRDIERYDASIQKITSSAHEVGVDKQLEAIQDALQGVQIWQTTSVQDQKRANLFRRLYTCPYKDRKDRNNRRVPGTCEWFTSHPQFTGWNQSANSELLWVSADPGCGKSVLTRYLVDEYLPSGKRTVCYFFFKDDFLDQKRATNALASILRQLLLAQPHLLQDSLLDQSEAAGDKFVESFNDLWSMFVRATADKNAGEVVCVLDALDECRGDDRKKLIQAVESLYLGSFGNRKVKFLMTSRPYDHIHRDFHNLEKNLPTIHLSGENEANVEMISKEINLVIKARVEEIGERNSLLPNECDFVSNQLTLVPNRTYLWVTLALDVVERMPGFSKGNVRRIVTDIPKDIDAAYTRILDRSPEHTKARRLLHIVTATYRPLTLKEISVALALSAKDQSIDDIQEEVQTDGARIQKMVRNLCGLFLVTIDGKVYLLHQTAKEFLVKNKHNSACGDTTAGGWKHSLHPEKSHYILARICTFYLSEDQTYDLFPCFLDYAAKCWAAHFRRASVSSEDKITKQARIVCNPESNLFNKWSSIYQKAYRMLMSLGDLHLAAALGLTAVVKLLLDIKEVDANSRDSGGRTPLSYAALYGFEEVVKLLLDTKEVDADPRDSGGQTPLSYAAVCGFEEVVKLLLETGKVEVNSTGDRGKTPLLYAAIRGHESVVKLLLETKGVEVDSKDYDRRTPLSYAADIGNEGVVKLLLDKDVEVDSKDNKGRTPLLYAIERGNEGVVKLLKTRKVEVDSKDSRGRTPLLVAANHGHEGVVDLLKTKEADKTSEDNKG
ncbi:sex-determining protein fem-1 [Nannizzia gypsea CBS 118893]|uniref:Sex-determining protein fem-1 n=1 Tax=Arthroderma gypseum (strain ATCC MYA-4604 / CBS 118893) TaxID=535722 RepID=E4V4E4_ARTGP|nr:sex-determining protein fem-1 [Nannizzia gypsea CBS 118893]EFR04868.1 sex-determining protein fem-1 [Nannizzia gypsea CBS 118893]